MLVSILDYRGRRSQCAHLLIHLPQPAVVLQHPTYKSLVHSMCHLPRLRISAASLAITGYHRQILQVNVISAHATCNGYLELGIRQSCSVRHPNGRHVAYGTGMDLQEDGSLPSPAAPC